MNGASATYSLVARYDILDASGTPDDSALFVLAWRGADADDGEPPITFALPAQRVAGIRYEFNFP